MMNLKSIHKGVDLLLASLIVFLLSACVPELPVELRNSGSLNLLPQIQGATQTKNVGDQVDGIANENALFTLDVFIKGTGENNRSFWKSYHLPTNGVNPTADVRNLLSSRWKDDGLVEGDSYAVYVVANHDFGNTYPSNLNTLANAWEDEFSDDCLWSDGTLDPSKLFLHKTYMESSAYEALTIRNKNRIYTPSKRYLMDGFVENWSPTGSGDQEIEVNLARAASKIEITIKFDSEFLESNPLDPLGQPGWRFINFAFDAPVIDPANLGQGTVDSQHMLSSGALLLGNANFVTTTEGNTSITSASIVTYSYPRKWAFDEAVEKAPSLVVSIPYKKGISYYRIPIVDQTETNEIGRNKIYRATAIISSPGSTSLDDLTESIVYYQVIPWNDSGHSGTQPADIVSTERMFLQVTPHTYVLRGNGTQTVDLTYYLPSGEHVGIQYFGQADNEKIAAGNSDQVGNNGANYTSGAPAAWYYNNKDAYRTTFLNSNVQVSISDNNAQDDVAKGTITVSSNSLANKAIKHIAFRVYLNVDDWYNKGLYRDIYIRHFPTDNIQAIQGSWSSRWNGQNTEIEYSWEPKEGWTEETGYFSYQEYLNDTQHIQREYSASNSNPGVTSNWDYYYSEANAYLHSDGYYYWRTGGGLFSSRTYHKAQYSGTRYYHEIQIASTGTWVDWERDEEKTYSQSEVKYTYDGDYYQAKVYYNGLIYAINVTEGGGYNNHTYYYSRATTQNAGGGYWSDTNWHCYSPDGYEDAPANMTGLNNNHMYVIQITRTSEKYVVGRPELDGNSQSNDHVVSPAFMIASQLGAVSTFNNGVTAAKHCATYMEVTPDGRRYTGWRLPTAEEIGVIIDYQGKNPNSVTIDETTITNPDDRILTIVLTGEYYWTLNNARTPTNLNSPVAGTGVRCVRDMSAAEIKALNKD